MLDADREADQARGDAGRALLLVGELECVVDAGWMTSAAHVADVGHVAVQLERLDERLAGLEAALDLEGEHRAGAARRVLLRPARTTGCSGRPA